MKLNIDKSYQMFCKFVSIVLYQLLKNILVSRYSIFTFNFFFFFVITVKTLLFQTEV